MAVDFAHTFEDFYRSDRDRLAVGLAAALGDSDLATEAVDEGMARAYQRWSKVGTYDNPGGWVYRVARNWAISRLRRRRFLSDSPLPEREFTMAPGHHDLLAGLQALPEPQRQVVVLKYLLGWSQNDIASSLNLRPGTVKSRLGRALAQLRIDLTDSTEEERS
ncbi:MAG: RNA polymerase sigma-70 factor (ECF subfamily) [Acidimicrobiales bacterium]|jgi:RNA polymerase sigma-70 factor, ECF subfamily